MCMAETCQEINCHICLIIYWTLYAMKKYWDCIKVCVEDICIYTLIALGFILKLVGKCGKNKKKDWKTIVKLNKV